MAVFPEGMNRLDVNDTAGSLSRLESYINYMGERIEFSMRNVTRNVSDAGVSNVDVVQRLDKLAGDLAALTSTVNSAAGDITSINKRIDEVQENIKTIQERLDALESGNGG